MQSIICRNIYRQGFVGVCDSAKCIAQSKENMHIQQMESRETRKRVFALNTRRGGQALDNNNY